MRIMTIVTGDVGEPTQSIWSGYTNIKETCVPQIIADLNLFLSAVELKFGMTTSSKQDNVTDDQKREQLKEQMNHLLDQFNQLQ